MINMALTPYQKVRAYRHRKRRGQISVPVEVAPDKLARAGLIEPGANREQIARATEQIIEAITEESST